jgi:flagellin
VAVNASSGAKATLTFNAASGDDYSSASGTVASFKDLTGQISFGGKTFDLGSVDYSSETSASGALADLNKAADAALGFASGTALFSASGSNLSFSVGAASGFTGTGGFALSDSAADIAAATPTFSGATGASNAITAIDKAIKQVSSQRADLGAIQNRFEHTVNNLNTAIENTTASESRIRDTDMASEMTKFTQAQVLQQAGTAMLAQANQSTQSILKLLG